MSLIPPPYRRLWTRITSGEIRDILIDGGVIYLVTPEEIAATDLTGQTLWHRAIKQGDHGEAHLALDADSLFVSRSGTPCLLWQFDRKTGATVWSHKTSHAAPILVRNGRLFILWSDRELVAISTTSHRVDWRCPIQSDPSDASKRILMSGESVSVKSGKRILVLDQSTGALRWERIARDPFLLATTDRLVVLSKGDVVASRGDQVAALDSETGKTVWEAETDFADLKHHSVALRNRLVLKAENTVTALSLTTGKAVWSLRRKGPKKLYASESGRVQDTLLLRHRNRGARANQRSRPLVAYSEDGKQLGWTRQIGDALPFWTDGNTLLALKGSRLFAYVSSPEPPPHANDQARVDYATYLVSQYAQLDEHETERLNSLGALAFEPLLRHLLRFRQERGQMPDRPSAFWASLRRCMAPEHTATLIEVIQNLDGGDVLEGVLVRTCLGRSDPELTGPFLFDRIKRAQREGDLSFSSIIGDCGLVLCELDVEGTTDLLIELLKDPRYTADGGLHPDVYTRLMGMGEPGAEALIGFLALREIRQELWPQTSRRAESDLERALEAAFDGWGGVFSDTAEVHFPKGIEPFAMIGTRAVCYTDGTAFGEGRAAVIIGLGFDKQIERTSTFPVGTVLEFSICRYVGELASRTDHARVRKCERGWLAVAVWPVSVS